MQKVVLNSNLLDLRSVKKKTAKKAKDEWKEDAA
jgi:hypothetical protein